MRRACFVFASFIPITQSNYNWVQLARRPSAGVFFTRLGFGKAVSAKAKTVLLRTFSKEVSAKHLTVFGFFLTCSQGVRAKKQIQNRKRTYLKNKKRIEKGEKSNAVSG